MRTPAIFSTVVAIVLAFIGLTGCGKPEAKKGAGHDHDHAHHDHDHDHAAHGPNGGHILEIGDEEYHAEWLHDDESGNVKVIILDDKMKKEVPIAAAEVVIATKIGEKTNDYKLAASNPSAGEKPTASRFELEDKTLVTALKAAGKGVEATLKLEIAGKAYSTKIEHSEHKH